MGTSPRGYSEGQYTLKKGLNSKVEKSPCEQVEGARPLVKGRGDLTSRLTFLLSWDGDTILTKDSLSNPLK